MTNGSERFARAAKDANCPDAQVRRFVRGGYVPQPQQLRFHAEARQADNPDGPDEIGIGGARGGGKSHAVMGQLALDDCQRRDGLKALFLRSVAKSARESFEDLIGRVCPQHWEHYQPGNGRILFPNGSRIVLGGFRTESDIGKYLGIEYDVIAIEETTLLSWDTYRKLLGSRRSSKDGWRERLYTTTNPGGIGHGWYKERFIEPWREKREGYTRFIFATYKDNAYISDSYIRYLNGLTGWLGRAWRDGDWDIAAGRFFTTFDYDTHVRAFESQPYWRYWLAMDYGYQHYTVVHLFGEDGDGHVYAVDEHAERRWLVKSHAGAIKAMKARHGIRRSIPFVAGSDVFAKRGDEATVAQQYASHGLAVEAAEMDRVNGAAEMLKRLGDPKQDIAPTWTIHPRCARLTDTLPNLMHDPHRPEDVLKTDTDEEGRGGDDAYDAARYGLMEAAHAYEEAGSIAYA